MASVALTRREVEEAQANQLRVNRDAAPAGARLYPLPVPGFDGEVRHAVLLADIGRPKLAKLLQPRARVEGKPRKPVIRIAFPTNGKNLLQVLRGVGHPTVFGIALRRRDGDAF